MNAPIHQSQQLPLTEETLRALMQDPRYWNSAHPEHSMFVAMVNQGFEHLFGNGPAPVDATGRVVGEAQPQARAAQHQPQPQPRMAALHQRLAQPAPMPAPNPAGADPEESGEQPPDIEEVFEFLRDMAPSERQMMLDRFGHWQGKRSAPANKQAKA